MTILIIGGTGTLSKSVTIMACKQGNEVTVLNRGTHNDLLPESVHRIKADFYDLVSLKTCLTGMTFDVVIDFLSRNKEDIKRVFPICSRICQQYVFISSACVFRREETDFPITESSPKPNTKWSYCIEKYEAEIALREYFHRINRSYYTIIRPYITYDENRIPIGIAPSYKYHRTIIERISMGKPMFVINGGSMFTTITYVTDFSKGVIGLLLNSKAINEDFNVVADFRCTQKELLEKLYSKLGKPNNIIEVSETDLCHYLPNYAGMIVGDRALNAVFDNRKLKDAIPNLYFEFDIDRGLDIVIERYKNSCSPIDYQYEGQTDYVLKRVGVKIPFIQEENYNNFTNKIIYLLYSKLPYSLSYKILRALRFLRLCTY